MFSRVDVRLTSSIVPLANLKGAAAVRTKGNEGKVYVDVLTFWFFVFFLIHIKDFHFFLILLLFSI